MKLSRVLVGSALFACAGVAQAAIVQTNSLDITSQTFFPVSNTDLIDQSQTTFAGQSESGYAALSGAGAATVLNDGSVGTSGGLITTLLDLDATYSFTYNLDTSVNTLGYDITSLATYTGWQSASDHNRVGVNFTVSYTQVGGGSGTIGTFVNGPITSVPALPQDASSKTLVTLSGADVVSGVNSLTFAFIAPPDGGLPGSPSSVSPILREIDAFGTATVPEPVALSLLGLTGLALMRRRHA